MATDLILKGALKLGAGPTDVSAEVTQVILKGMRADVSIPATLATPKGHAAGSAKYEISIDYFSDDSGASTLFSLLWAAVASASKELAYEVTLRDGSVSPSNPKYSGTLIVAGADLGGDQEALSTGSIKCTLTGKPSVATS